MNYHRAHRKFLKIMLLVYRRGGGSAVLSDDPGKVPLNTKDRESPAVVVSACLSIAKAGLTINL